jgi:hypothetical protein
VSMTIPLSPSGQRALAASMVRTATDNPHTVTPGAAVLLVDTLDALSGVLLAYAGLDRDASRSVLAVLWGTK